MCLSPRLVLFSCLLALATGAATPMAQSSQASGGPLGPPMAPAENPVTPEKAVLGKMLFWEEQLSNDDTMACGTCHRPASGFCDPREATHPGPDTLFGTADDLFTSPGVVYTDAANQFQPDPLFGLHTQKTGRRSPDIFGAMYGLAAFWDGRATTEFYDPVSGALSIPWGGSLESQIAAPPVSAGEMGRESRTWTDIVAKLQNAVPMRLATHLPPDIQTALATGASYPDLFNTAFGSPTITAERIIFSIATYERTLVPNRAPYFRWLAGDPQALTPDQIAGQDQFMTIAQCQGCHPPPAFAVGEYFNLGLRPWQDDPGRMNVTGSYANRGQFKAPSLLNAGLRPRYFHTGQANTLWPGGVGQIYMNGGGPNHDNLDPLMHPLNQVPGIDMAKIMDFVANGLTDPRLARERPPFDRPTLRSETLPTNLFGTGTPPPGGPTPRILAQQPAYSGDGSFRIGLDGGPALARARLVISKATKGGLLRHGAALYTRPDLSHLLPVTLEDDGNGNGFATVALPIPAQPALIGSRFYAQWFMEDLSAPTGVISSEAAEFRITK